MEAFDVKTETKKIINWIKAYFEPLAVKKAVLGVSGGKDSAVAAALLACALGKENVTGIMIPNGIQKDIADSVETIKILGIKSMTVNIEKAYKGLTEAIGLELSADSLKNIPPRLRMTTLYAAAQTIGALVCGTSNASEYYVGYGTKWGDLACDFNPIREFYTDEVIAIGEYLGLPERLTRKTPADGLSESTDEEALGVTYAEINSFARGEKIGKPSEEKIKRLNGASMHKRNPISVYKRG